jgi:hypothetical protein
MCGDHQFARNEWCRKCGAPRNGAIVTEDQVGLDAPVQQKAPKDFIDEPPPVISAENLSKLVKSATVMGSFVPSVAFCGPSNSSLGSMSQTLKGLTNNLKTSMVRTDTGAVIEPMEQRPEEDRSLFKAPGGPPALGNLGKSACGKGPQLTFGNKGGGMFFGKGKGMSLAASAAMMGASAASLMKGGGKGNFGGSPGNFGGKAQPIQASFPEPVPEYANGEPSEPCTSRLPQKGDKVLSIDGLEKTELSGWRLEPREIAVVAEVNAQGHVRLRNGSMRESKYFLRPEYYGYLDSVEAEAIVPAEKKARTL